MSDASERERAIIDAIKSIADMIMTINEGTAKGFEKVFKHQRKEHLARGHKDAADVFEILEVFVADPKRKAYRKQLRQFLSAPTAGRA